MDSSSAKVEDLCTTVTSQGVEPATTYVTAW